MQVVTARGESLNPLLCQPIPAHSSRQHRRVLYRPVLQSPQRAQRRLRYHCADRSTVGAAIALAPKEAFCATIVPSVHQVEKSPNPQLARYPVTSTEGRTKIT